MTTTLQDVPFAVSIDHRATAADHLNRWLPELIALGLELKQAHWNLRGARFKSVHEQLDEILLDVRRGSDDVAERIVTIGSVADGLPHTVAKAATAHAFPDGRMSVEDAVRRCCDALAATIRSGRQAIEALGECDPVSEDLAISIVGPLEKHHWMLRSQLDPTGDEG